MNANPFVLVIALPPLGTEAPHAVLSLLTDRMDELRYQCRTAFTLALDELVKTAQIKRYAEVTTRQLWTHSSEFPEPFAPSPARTALIDLTRPGELEVDFLGYEIAFPAGGPLVVPEDLGSYREPPPFLKVQPPWRIELYRATVRKLKTQDNLVFKVSLRLTFPLLDATLLPAQDTCQHRFRLLDYGDWQWRLLWECMECGFVCHCECFRRAIESDPFPKRMEGQWPKHVQTSPNQVPFLDGACELCRGVPSTHRFCNPQYARSVFEAKYGAYLRKRLAELRLEGQSSIDEKIVENELRKELGLPPFGMPGFSEAELFRIVRALFAQEEVRRRVRPDWLDGLELDIFVPSQSIAIEYHGPQHFAPVWPHDHEESFRQMQERDARKKARLIDRGIALCVFTDQDELSPDHVRAAIERARKWKGGAS